MVKLHKVHTLETSIVCENMNIYKRSKYLSFTDCDAPYKIIMI